MGAIGALYHGAKGFVNWICNDSDGLSKELDKAVDSLHRTVIIDPIGISDLPDIVEDFSGED